MDKFGIDIARSVAARLSNNCPGLSGKAFVLSAQNVESGGWVNRISSAVRTHLPEELPIAIDVVLKSIGPELPPEEPMPEAHTLTPLVHFVATYGTEHIDLSLHALRELSKRTYTAQAGVRMFLINNTEPTMKILQQWTRDRSPHVRRLVASATRPRLRYAVMPGLTDLHSFRENPAPVLKLLDSLRNDPSASVRKVVAGNLSDIAKDSPEVIFDRIEEWLKHDSKQTRQTVRYALRYSSRKGIPRAVKLLEQAKKR